ncbi:hypothetical protein C5975_20360 [Cronobacter sakazakii]|nr:hypothetical protein C5975_20360 [Cronobacter sakazakii]PQY53715.1 hypothetical protein C5954_20670 [Cronobacter sakazakii]
MWYREGTITFTQGSNTLTGTGTFWNVTANGVLPGMIVVGPDNKLYCCRPRQQALLLSAQTTSSMKLSTFWTTPI